jgi:cbb3-type cytochrome oxidase subunit 1
MTALVDKSRLYNDHIVRLFTLAAVFWGVIGMTVGLLLALQMTWPQFNLGEYLSFGRLRPLHRARAACSGQPCFTP